MPWETLQPRPGKRQAQGIRIGVYGGEHPKIDIRFGPKASTILGIEQGDYVQVLYNLSERSLAFRKANRETGYKVKKVNRPSKIISFQAPQDQNTHLLLLAVGEHQFETLNNAVVIRL